MKRTTKLIIIEAALLALLWPICNITHYLATKTDSGSAATEQLDFEVIKPEGDKSAIRTLTVTTSNQSIIDVLEGKTEISYPGAMLYEKEYSIEIPDFIIIQVSDSITEPIIKLFGEDWTTLSAEMKEGNLKLSLHPVVEIREKAVEDEDDEYEEELFLYHTGENGLNVVLPANNTLQNINILVPVRHGITLSDFHTDYLTLSIPEIGERTKLENSNISSLLIATNEYFDSQDIKLFNSRIDKLRVAPDIRDFSISSDSISQVCDLQWPVSVATPYTGRIKLDLSCLENPVNAVVDSDVDLRVTERVNLKRIKPTINAAYNGK